MHIFGEKDAGNSLYNMSSHLLKNVLLRNTLTGNSFLKRVNFYVKKSFRYIPKVSAFLRTLDKAVVVFWYTRMRWKMIQGRKLLSISIDM